MRYFHTALVGILVLSASACQQQPETRTLAEARQGFKTKLRAGNVPGTAIPEPPADIFIKTKFEAPGGKLSTYVTPDPKDKKKHPAIIWITGGDCNSVDDSIWKKNVSPANDQTASAFRKAGIIMMFPSLRGGNDNPGAREGGLGEVDDVLAAADFLAKRDYVDDKHIYLGGHSTGGTLVLLTAEVSDRFRATFSFGPTDTIANYPSEYKPFDNSNRVEIELRSPIRWLHGIKSPVFVFEGTTKGGNLTALENMKRATTNDKVQFFAVSGADHFSLLAPVTQHIAQKILRDDGEKCNIAFTKDEVNKLMGK